MSELHQALSELSVIRRQVARSTQFRGYGPATLAFTGVLGIVAAAVQAWLVPEPAAHLHSYLVLWIVTALVGSSTAGWQIHRRTRRLHSALSAEMLRIAIEQFLPAAMCGLLLTAVMIWRLPGQCTLLPGLWQLVFALGVFSSCRFLPRWMVLPGGWYLISGLATLSLGDARALAPWTMGVGFGAGQLLVAAVLLQTREEAAHGA